MAVLEATPAAVPGGDWRPTARSWPGPAPDGRRRTDRRVDRSRPSAIFVAFCVSISVGDFPIPLRDVVPAIFGFGNEDADFIVRTLRLPRALTGLLVGRGVRPVRRDLPEPGPQPAGQPRHHRHHAGASAAAVFVIVVVGGSYVAGLGRRPRRRAAHGAGRSTSWRGSGACRPTGWCSSASASPRCSASVTAYLLTRAEIYDAQRATVWLTGSLNGRGWEHVRPLALALVVLVPARAACWLAAAAGAAARRRHREGARGRRRAVADRPRHRRRRAGRRRHGVGRADRVRRLRGAADRPPAHAHQPDDRARGARWGAPRARWPTWSPAGPSPRPSCRWASSPASSARRTCCGCWPGPTRSGRGG